MKKFLCILLLLGLTGCAKKVVSPPVPGSINSLDAFAFRVLSDAQAALTPVKVWEQCSALSIPTAATVTITVDGNVQVCDPSADPFPAKFKPVLNDAINAYNSAQTIAKAYHDGLSPDTTALQTSLTTLGNSVGTMLSTIGGK